MPLLEITQSRQISASVRLDEATATQVDQYAAFIKASADDVVDKALNYVFSKDRDFQDFLKTPEAKQISSTLRVRKAPSTEVVDQPCEEGRRSDNLRGTTASGEGVIRRSIPGWSDDGASHRMNCDTPPLKGYCQEPWFLGANVFKTQTLQTRVSLLGYQSYLEHACPSSREMR